MDLARRSMRLVVDARTSAFAAFVDYAGVFPPASLTVADATACYRAARTSQESWVAGRFLIRTSQLQELAAEATATMQPGEDPWEVSAIFDSRATAAASLASDFHAEMEPALTVAAAEALISEPSRDGIAKLFTTIGSINPDVVGFLEVARSSDVEAQIRRIASVIQESGRTGGSKLRCGGVTADMFPSPSEVAVFIQTTVEESVPFKATAGLHQPFRHFDESLGIYRHGFVNILLATTAAADGAALSTVTDIISETEPGAFGLSAAFATWGDLRFPGSTLRRTRQNLFVAYGSCDFEEPIEALRAIGLLGEGS